MGKILWMSEITLILNQINAYKFSLSLQILSPQCIPRTIPMAFNEHKDQGGRSSARRSNGKLNDIDLFLSFCWSARARASSACYANKCKSRPSVYGQPTKREQRVQSSYFQSNIEQHCRPLSLTHRIAMRPPERRPHKTDMAFITLLSRTHTHTGRTREREQKGSYRITIATWNHPSLSNIIINNTAHH